jgi:hypothetical protein
MQHNTFSLTPDPHYNDAVAYGARGEAPKPHREAQACTLWACSQLSAHSLALSLTIEERPLWPQEDRASGAHSVEACCPARWEPDAISKHWWSGGLACGLHALVAWDSDWRPIARLSATGFPGPSEAIDAERSLRLVDSG